MPMNTYCRATPIAQPPIDLATRRRELFDSQLDAAHKLDVNQGTISLFEQGRPIGEDVHRQLVDAYKIASPTVLTYLDSVASGELTFARKLATEKLAVALQALDCSQLELDGFERRLSTFPPHKLERFVGLYRHWLADVRSKRLAVLDTLLHERTK